MVAVLALTGRAARPQSMVANRAFPAPKRSAGLTGQILGVVNPPGVANGEEVEPGGKVSDGAVLPA